MVNVSEKNISGRFYHFRKKAKKSKLLLNLLWKRCSETVSLSRSRIHKPTKLSWLQNITLIGIWCLLKQFHSDSVLLSVDLISLNKKHGLKCFRDLFEVMLTYIIFFVQFPIRNWHQPFYI